MRSLTRAHVRIRYYFHALRTTNATLLLLNTTTQSGTRLRVFDYRLRAGYEYNGG